MDFKRRWRGSQALTRLRVEIGIRRRQWGNFIAMMKVLHTPLRPRISYGIGIIIVLMGIGYYDWPIQTADLLDSVFGVKPITVAVTCGLSGLAIILSRMKGIVAYIAVITSVGFYTIFFSMYALAGGAAPRMLLGLSWMAFWLLMLRVEPSVWLGKHAIRLGREHLNGRWASLARGVRRVKLWVL